MNKLIKGLLLFTALLLPVLIFVFLKMFGENQFDIPIYNHTEIVSEADCEDITIPHIVEAFEIENERITASSVVNIYHIFGEATNESEMRGLMKVKDQLDGEKAAIHSIGSSGNSLSIAALAEKYQIEGLWSIYQTKESRISDFTSCELIITGGESIVLVDIEGKIRGYYNGRDEEETDKLILESKILIYGDEKSGN